VSKNKFVNLKGSLNGEELDIFINLNRILSMEYVPGKYLCVQSNIPNHQYTWNGKQADEVFLILKTRIDLLG
jgi:hypothetical protein